MRFAQGSSMNRIWLNKTSVVLCCICLSIAALLFALMHLSTDTKGAYFWGQLAGAPALALLTWTGTVEFTMNHFPWLNTYPGVTFVSLVICYGVGVIVGVLQQAFRDKTPT
jgi:hypothetical protein